MAMAAFAGAGKKTGIEIWRIEKMEPAKVDQKEHGQFFSGDCYLVLKTYEVKGAIYQDLFFWLGKDSSQDERGAAAYHTVTLDDSLGGKPVQHREVQGSESKEFMSLFPAIQYLDGGVASGFRHVDPDKYEPRLFHCKGKRNVRVQQVKLSSESLNEGDVFILDTGKQLYQWNGRHANKYEKFKALELCTKINADERGGKAEFIVLDDGKEDNDETFWKILGGKKKIKTAEEAGSDDDAKAHGDLVLLRVSDASGSLQITEVARHKLERSQLDSNDAFIVDNGAEIFVWIGKGANKDERKKALEFGAKYLKDHNRPDTTPVTRIAESGETPSFKSCFFQWDPIRVVKAEEAKAVVQEAKIDVSAMHKKRVEAEEKMADDASGKVKVFRVENMQRVPVQENLYGQFYQGDSYVILYSYVVNKKEKYIIYFWQGRDSSQDEKAASALIAKQMDDELGGDPVQVRVVQNKEPNHFLALFKGKMVVHQGGKASGFKNKKDEDSYDTDGVSLFQVKGTNALNTRAIQVDEVSQSLNSGDCFVLVTPGTLYVWQGKGSTDDERNVAANIAATLQFGRALVTLNEGEEPAEFWSAIGGNNGYADSKVLAAGSHEPRLFQVTNSKKGVVSVEEVCNFSQDDLLNDDVMVLDAFDEVFVWIGHDSNQDEKERAMKVALDYVKSAKDGRGEDTPVYKVMAGSEPPNFTCHFHGWKEDKAASFEDPYAKKLGQVKVGKPKAGAGVERVDENKIGFAKPAAQYTLAELQSKAVPAGVDPANKELYLNDKDFQAAFAVSRDEFAKMPLWKKQQLKKKVNLF